MTRPMAHVERILSVFPIPGADAIEVIQVLGWYIVAQKTEEHKVGDLVVFYEIDSFLNAEDLRYSSFEERFTNWDGKRGMRLKTIKLRGQVSQGLALKIKYFPEIKNPVEGLDVTELLKIEKWESVADLAEGRDRQNQGKKGPPTFPSFIPKTDQTRVQSLISVLNKYADESFEVTTKLDGSSMTVYVIHPNSPFYKDAVLMGLKETKGLWAWIKAKWNQFKTRNIPKEPIYATCSRNVQLKDGDGSHFTEYVRKNSLYEKISMAGGSYAFQGELIGPTIQENHEKVKDFEYRIFDVFDIDKQNYLLPKNAQIMTGFVGLKYVPVVHDGVTINELTGYETEPSKVVAKLLELAEGPGMNEGVKREGQVYKHMSTGFSFKAISNSYLLKKDKK